MDINQTHLTTPQLLAEPNINKQISSWQAASCQQGRTCPMLLCFQEQKLLVHCVLFGTGRSLETRVGPSCQLGCWTLTIWHKKTFNCTHFELKKHNSQRQTILNCFLGWSKEIFKNQKYLQVFVFVCLFVFYRREQSTTAMHSGFTQRLF